MAEVELWTLTLDTLTKTPVKTEGVSDVKQREELFCSAKKLYETDKWAFKVFISDLCQSDPTIQEKFDITWKAYFDSLMWILKPENNNNINKVKSTQDTESEVSNQPSKKVTEQKERQKISERLELADFAYVDLKKNEKTWVYEVSDNEKMNKYVYTKAKELLNTLENSVSVAKIEQKLKYPNEKINLDENELSALNCIKDNIYAWSQYALNTNWSTSLDINWNIVTSDLEAKFTIPSPMSVLIKTKNELLSILETVANIPWNVVDSTVWTLKNVWYWLEKKFKWFFNDSKEIDQTKLTEYSKKWLTVINQEQDNSSWFSATLIKDTNTNEITLWIRWTDDFTDMIYSNLRISDSRAKNIFNATDWMPSQMVSLINYIENNPEIKKIREAKWHINVVGHSLGWAVSQLLKAMYPWLVKETHTFNAPWIKQITPTLNPTDRKALEKANNSELINKIDSILKVYPGNLKSADFSKVLNIRNHDWIWSVWDSIEWWWHIWVTTEKIPWDLHFLDWIRDNLDSLSPKDFDRIFNLNAKDKQKIERELK